MWLFGYGSLIWKPGFAYVQKREVVLRGWRRRFYQGSPDHRGTPEAPGRVVTLLPAPQEERCVGVAYLLDAPARERILAALDHREKAGYVHHRSVVHCLQSSEAIEDVLFYIAPEDNPNFLGPAPLEDMARQILSCHGPSGPNLDYLLRLAESLQAMGAEDTHVFTLAQEVQRLQSTMEP